MKAGGFDRLDRSFLSTIGVSHGVAENFQVGLTLGYYNAVNSREAEFDPDTGETEILTSNPDGLTDRRRFATALGLGAKVHRSRQANRQWKSPPK